MCQVPPLKATSLVSLYLKFPPDHYSQSFVRVLTQSPDDYKDKWFPSHSGERSRASIKGKPFQNHEVKQMMPNLAPVTKKQPAKHDTTVIRRTIRNSGVTGLRKWMEHRPIKVEMRLLQHWQHVHEENVHCNERLSSVMMTVWLLFHVCLPLLAWAIVWNYAITSTPAQ